MRYTCNGHVIRLFRSLHRRLNRNIVWATGCLLDAISSIWTDACSPFSPFIPECFQPNILHKHFESCAQTIFKHFSPVSIPFKTSRSWEKRQERQQTFVKLKTKKKQKTNDTTLSVKNCIILLKFIFVARNNCNCVCVSGNVFKACIFHNSYYSHIFSCLKSTNRKINRNSMVPNPISVDAIEINSHVQCKLIKKERKQKNQRKTFLYTKHLLLYQSFSMPTDPYSS